MKSPAKLWIDALLSGKYKQTKGYLKFKGRHCCLGVLCEVFNNVNDEKLVTEEVGLNTFFDGESQYLPRKVLFWLLKDKRLKDINTFCNGLVIQNDSGMSFGSIANLIKGFFKED